MIFIDGYDWEAAEDQDLELRARGRDPASQPDSFGHEYEMGCSSNSLSDVPPTDHFLVGFGLGP